LAFVTALFCAVFGWSDAASAATATFVNPGNYTAADALAVSSADGIGLSAGRNEPFEIVTDALFATSKADDNVSIFTLNNAGRRALIGRIEIGVFQNGTVNLVASRSFRAGTAVNIDNLFRQPCAGFGGCNFIRIFTHNGAPDETVQIDYITIDGEVVHVSAPAPEPEVWVLMILGFWAIAFRLKKIRYRNLQPVSP